MIFTGDSDLNEQSNSTPTDAFESLPDRAPYGFSVSPNGKFSIVSDWGAHSEASKELGFKNTDVLVHEGGVRMYHGNLKTGTFAASYVPRKVTRLAMTTANDLAKWYRRELEYDNDPYLKEHIAIEPLDSFETLPDTVPYGFTVSPTGKFVVVSTWGAHSKAAQHLGHDHIDALVAAGGSRMYGGGRYDKNYSISFSPSKLTNSAKKTSLDLAGWYGRELRHDKDPYFLEHITTSRKPTMFKLKEFFPELLGKDAVNEVALGLGGGYGGAAGGPTAGSWAATPVSPGFSDARAGMFKSQNYANPATGSNGAVTMAQLMQGQNYPNMPYGDMRNGAKYTPATKPVSSGGNNIPPKSGAEAPKLQRNVSTMQGNTVISNGLVDVISPEDLSDPRFDPDEIRTGVRQEMRGMEFPMKTVALMKAKENLAKNPKYYSNLGSYLDND